MDKAWEGFCLKLSCERKALQTNDFGQVKV